jgi:transcriptional regulator with XRE-family HTH domain
MKPPAVSSLVVNPGRFRDRRKARGLSREQLAVAAGYSFNLVVKIERGTVTPSLTSLGAFAAALGCDPSELLDHTTGNGAGS